MWSCSVASRATSAIRCNARSPASHCSGVSPTDGIGVCLLACLCKDCTSTITRRDIRRRVPCTFVIHARREGYPSTGLPFTTPAKPVNVAQHLPRRYEPLCQPQRRPLRTMSSSHRSVCRFHEWHAKPICTHSHTILSTYLPSPSMSTIQVLVVHCPQPCYRCHPHRLARPDPPAVEFRLPLQAADSKKGITKERQRKKKKTEWLQPGVVCVHGATDPTGSLSGNSHK
ncbi:hypothetical protein J3F84DRAFT_366641 [Trichoderma pleuroticola]